MALSELDKRFIEMYHEIGRYNGIGSPLSSIFAKVYLEPSEISMDEIAKETGYSLATVSNQLKVLEAMMPIKKIRRPGSKKIFLYTDKNIIKVIRDQLSLKEERCIGLIKERLPATISEFKDKAKNGKEKKKIRILEDYYKQILRCETIMHEVIDKFDRLLVENEKK